MAKIDSNIVLNVLITGQDPTEKPCVIDENGMPWWSATGRLAHTELVQGDLCPDSHDEECWFVELDDKNAQAYMNIVRSVLREWVDFALDTPEYGPPEDED